MKKVLITDDEKSFLLSLQDGFKIHDDTFTILTAENGQEAVKILEKTFVDLLVTDLEMPLMNGFELLAWTSRQLPQLPVIVMTAFGTPEIESRLAQFETLQYLEKPLDLETLENAILDGLENGAKSYIQGITVASFLQLLHLEKKSCTLKISSTKRTGYLYLSEGELVDAEYGQLTGEEAAHQIVCWDKTEIEMENLCQRQENLIENSLESILLNAHQQKDEQGQEAVKTPEHTTEPLFPPRLKEEEESGKREVAQSRSATKGQAQELLVEKLNLHKAISEFILFDQYSVPEKQNPGKCSLHAFDPAIYLHLAGLLGEKLGFGACNWFSFFTARRTPFLLFNMAGYSLLVKLQHGVRPQVIGVELSDIINKAMRTE